MDNKLVLEYIWLDANENFRSKLKIIDKEGNLLVENIENISGYDKDIAVLQKELELLKLQIEEIKISSSNPLSPQ